MAIGSISGSPAAGIDNVLAQLRMAQARTQTAALTAAGSAPVPGAAESSALNGSNGVLRGALALSADSASAVGGIGGAAGFSHGGFAAALQSSLDQVSSSQLQAQQLGTAFEKGEGGVDLNDVMIAMQKANVSFQGAVQVRNRMISAYHDIMNMQL